METKPHPWSIPGRAAQAGVCVATIYNEMKRGRLKGRKVGARTIIPDDDWNEYLERSNRQTVQGGA